MLLAAAWAELYAECEDWNGELFKPPQALQALVKDRKESSNTTCMHNRESDRSMQQRQVSRRGGQRQRPSTVGENSCGIQEAGCVKDEPDSELNLESCGALVAPPSDQIKEEFLEDTEQQQVVNITSTDHVGNKESMLKLKCVKEEPISEWDQNVSEAVQALLTDLSINNEFILKNGEFQPVNAATSDSGLKLPHIQEMTSTVKHRVKHQTDLASAVSAIIDEVDQLASKPNSFVSGCEDAEPARGSKGSSCAIVSGESALRQIVAGCYVKLQRLRLLQCSLCEKIFHKYSSLRTHYTDSHVNKNNINVTKKFHLGQAKSVSVEKHATDPAKLAKRYYSIVQAKSVSVEKRATDPAKIAEFYYSTVQAKSVSVEKRATDPAKIAEFYYSTVQAKSVSVEKRAKDLVNIAKLHPCDICNEKFAFKADMQIHRHEQHRQEQHTGKRYKCDVCEKQFIHLHKLNKHTKLHSGMKFYSCKFCKETFTFREEIIRHLWCHTGETCASDMYDRRLPLPSGMKSNRIIHMDKLARTKQNLQCGYCHNDSTV